MKNPFEKIICALIISAFAFLLFSFCVFSSEEISLSAKSSCLYEPSQKNFIVKKNSDRRMPMASTTKIMTALVVSERLDLDDVVTVPSQATGIEGSSLYLKEGEKITVKDLLYALMLRSANDAAACLAIHTAGSIERFSDLMNEESKKLGLLNTSFKNPHGLDVENHYTTAEDLAVIAARCMEIPIIYEIAKSKNYTVNPISGETRRIVNHNKLLTLYDGAIGLKTGYTKKSGRCLVGCAEKNGLRFITVTLSAPDDWEDHKKLFDLGFSLYEKREIVSPYDFTYTLPILKKSGGVIKVSNRDSFSYIARKDDPEITHEVKLLRQLTAPLNKNIPVGKVIFKLEDKVIGEIFLYPEEDVTLKVKKSIFNIF